MRFSGVKTRDNSLVFISPIKADRTLCINRHFSSTNTRAFIVQFNSTKTQSFISLLSRIEMPDNILYSRINFTLIEMLGFNSSFNSVNMHTYFIINSNC
jgi:hypothetical protein